MHRKDLKGENQNKIKKRKEEKRNPFQKPFAKRV
jgi:hypothetical protein